MPQRRDIVRRWLDEQQILDWALAENELGYRSYSSPRLHCSRANVLRERIDDPAVIVGCLGNRVELGAGVRKIGGRHVANLPLHFQSRSATSSHALTNKACSNSTGVIVFAWGVTETNWFCGLTLNDARRGQRRIVRKCEGVPAIPATH